MSRKGSISVFIVLPFNPPSHQLLGSQQACESRVGECVERCVSSSVGLIKAAAHRARTQQHAEITSTPGMWAAM